MTIRWMHSGDTNDVVEIGELTDTLFSEQELEQLLKKKTNVGMIVEHQDEIVGFFIYKVRKEYNELIRLAIHPNYQRKGFGKEVINKLLSKKPLLIVSS